MIRIYKFTEYTPFLVRLNVLDTLTSRNIDGFNANWCNREHRFVIPIPKNFDIEYKEDSNNSVGAIDFTNLINSNLPKFDFSSKLFIHSNCKIPRANVTQKYTRVLKSDNADVCVVPTPYKFETEYVSVFANKDKCKVYVILSDNNYDYNTRKIVYKTSKKCENFPLGSTIVDINPVLRNSFINERTFYGDDGNTFSNENWRDFLESKLVYTGQALLAYTNDLWLGNYMYNQLHHVVPEDKILATLGDDTNKFDKDTYNSISEMLNSTDDNVVGLGLKALAELDYKKYHNTVVHLLNNCGNNLWRNNDMRKSSSVKFMLKYLDLWNYVSEKYITNTDQEDFDMLKEVIEQDFKKVTESMLNRFKQRFNFMDITFDYSFSVQNKSEESEETQAVGGEENDDFDDDFDD